MKTFWFIPFLAMALLSQGCTVTSFHRTIYDIVQNWGAQHCQQEPGRECPEPQNYDDYQRERNATPGE